MKLALQRRSSPRYDFKGWIASAAWLLSIFALRSFGQATLFDGSFAVGGGADDGVNSLVIQSDGGIWVGGWFQTIAGHSHSNLARLKSDGSYDGSLVSGTDAQVTKLIRQPDGKILVAGGFTNLQGVVRWRIGRLLADGQVDPEFDAGAVLEMHRLAMTLGLQPDGKILVATMAEDLEGGDLAGRLFRLQANGGLDESFVQTNLFMDWHIFAIHVRSNGTILVGGGFSSAGGHASPGLALLEADGRPATNFNANLENHSTIFSILEQTNGNLLIGGTLRRAGESNYTAVARCTADLRWDSTFSTDPFVFDLFFHQEQPYVRSVLEQPDGKLVVAGRFSTVGGYWRRNIARLDAEGRVDPCFDPGLGLATQYLGAFTLALQSDGRILVGGDWEAVDDSVCANLARLLPQSDCDATRVHFGSSPDGWHYVAGTSPPGGEMFVQASTNLVDWTDWNPGGSEQDIVEPAGSFRIYSFVVQAEPPLFFRVRKAY